MPVDPRHLEVPPTEREGGWESEERVRLPFRLVELGAHERETRRHAEGRKTNHSFPTYGMALF